MSVKPLTTCFVPECSNTVGVLFPKNLEVRRKWLKALDLEDKTPNQRSFVCLDHFQSNGQPGIRTAKNTSSDRDKKVEQFSSGSALNFGPNKSALRTEQKSSAIKTREKSKKLQTPTVCKKFEKMCRLCMVQSSEVTENVYNKIDETHTIAQAISICLHPLKVLPNDKLSKKLCANCLQFLKEYFDFHQMCLEMDAKQWDLSDRNEQDEDTGESEQEQEEEELEYLHEERLSDYEEDKENNKTVTNGLVNEEIYDKEKEDLLKVLEGKEDIELTKIDKAKPVETSKSVNENIEGELSDNLHEQEDQYISDDDKNMPTENIIIEMVDEEEPETINNSKTKKRKLSEDDNLNGNKTLILPSGIRVEVNEPYRSGLGIFTSERIQYVFDSKYLLAGGYLYDLRLMKNNIRRLKCIVNNCPGVAEQRLLCTGKFDININVVAPHNHKIPNGIERKKHMFYHILNMKMKRDKNFNFKTFYETMCQLDKSISQILPLRQVIQTICKQGPNPLPPLLRTFDDFYKHIENDEFHKIHFTSNYVQFYQTKCESTDGGKAVIFGNPDVISAFSHSKLMHVDASFIIDSQDFAYHLLTVLVWIDESYYPILYAIINIKSQEIYKKIFQYLSEKLAPNLRPAEIVTDFEANLYYALAETYVDSSIGGSVFYFAENIYKKICSLNLARELELNSNFRNIYNMILMLPLLPVNTILDGLQNVEEQALQLDLQHLTNELFKHVRTVWIEKVTPELFCVHRLENRINENIVAPFKKLRDLIMLSKAKGAKSLPAPSILIIIEKLLDLEKYLRETFISPKKNVLVRDVSSSQKRMILKAWNYIENYPMININQFFMKVLGYIKCLENQLWIWGFYRLIVTEEDILIDANNFSIEHDENLEIEYAPETDEDDEPMEEITLKCTEANNENEEQSMIVAEESGLKHEENEDDENTIIEEFYIEEGGEIRRVTNEKSRDNFIQELTDELNVTEDRQEETNEAETENVETIYKYVYK